MQDSQDAANKLKSYIDTIGTLAPQLDNLVKIFSGLADIHPIHCRQAICLLDNLYAVLGNLAGINIIVDKRNVKKARGLIDGTNELRVLFDRYRTACLTSNLSTTKNLKQKIYKKLGEFVELMKTVLVEFQPYYPND